LHKRTRGFPRAGYARLRAQLTGAADSIKDTIAEGCGAATNKNETIEIRKMVYSYRKRVIETPDDQ